ncbi:multicopy suppressor of BFA (Brefeldin A) [Marasmius tenuissimus]|uniref:Multicopy suppressor of BFA (Brefeldin A) n=1 Tax=Marasmius tenuissimus TaxID=585030 RepID=A0ABR3AAP6_9AGAR|nr:multicopy suppressor of BFA (Brefeldin A) [Marasmius tenuissimus]
MAAAAAKSKTNGASGKGKTPESTSGTATPVSTVPSEKKTDAPVPTAGGKPDKKVYDAEQQRLKGEIDALQLKLSAVKDKISLATKGGSGNEKRNALKAELDGIRDQQSSNKSSKGKIHDQIKSHNEFINKKIADLQASKGKIPYRSVAEVDSRISNLEKQIESGNMKLADEKRALQEISQCKRNRRTVEGFQADQDAIEAERKKIDELKKQLDDPEFKAISDRYDQIRDELAVLKKEEDEAYQGRSKLFEERDNLQVQVNTLYNEKRESSSNYREANDRYWTKVNEDRARRAEKAKSQRAADELAKKQEIAQRLRDEAEVPAFQAQIEDCQTLIDALSGKTSGEVTYKSTPLHQRGEIAGVAKLDIRKVEAAPEGMVARKKKGEEEDNYFVAGKGKSKGNKKQSAKSNDNADAASTTSSQLNLPFSTLSALLTLSIPPPTSASDVPRVIENVKTKKAWFEANQARVTAENISKAEADIQRLNDSKEAVKSQDSSNVDVTPPNGGGERPGEPAPTPKATDLTSVAVPTEEVDNKLESVKEQNGEAEAEA